MKQEREESITLGILAAIDTQSDVTQRGLASELGVALGLANFYLRRCVRKGLVKIHQAPANRYLYYLTPQGFAEKSRLTAEYLSSSFDYYNRAGKSIAAMLGEIVANNRRRVLFAGVSEVAEIASVRALDFDIKIVGTFDLYAVSAVFIGRPVWHERQDVVPFDAVLYTDITAQRGNYDALRPDVDAGRVYVPDILLPALEHPGA
jgi:DNA-binding MarR family transcriptional regulator